MPMTKKAEMKIIFLFTFCYAKEAWLYVETVVTELVCCCFLDLFLVAVT